MIFINSIEILKPNTDKLKLLAKRNTVLVSNYALMLKLYFFFIIIIFRAAFYNDHELFFSMQ